MWIGALIAGLFGLFVGSFCNVVIHRMPRNESVVTPPSRCYACGSAIAWYDNLPVLSYLLLRGRCRACGSRYSPRYLIGELAVGLLSAGAFLLAWQVTTATSGFLPWTILMGLDEHLILGLTVGACLVAGWWLWIATVIDCQHQVIPDELTKPMQLLAPALALCAPVAVSVGWQAQPDWVMNLRGNEIVATPWRALGLLGWAVAGTVVVLVVTLPAVQGVYRRLSQGAEWAEADLRGLRMGVWWFVGCCLVHLGIAALLAAQAAAVPVPVQQAEAWAMVIVEQGSDPRRIGDPAVPGAGWLALQAQWTTAVLGSLAGWMSLYLVGLIGTLAFRRLAMGFGDVKLLAPLGAFLGPVGVLYTIGFAALVGAVVGIPLRLLGGGRELPFGPYLMLGAVLTVLVGPALHELFFAPLAP